MKTLTQYISDTLHLPEEEMLYEFSRAMSAIYPDRYLIETEDYSFDLEEFIRKKQCEARISRETHAQQLTVWYDERRGATTRPRNALLDILWRGHRFHVLRITYGRWDTSHYYVMGPNERTARAFFAHVCRWCDEVRGEVLVFRGGCWERDEELHKSIQKSRLSNLILQPGLAERLLKDFEGFFAARDHYARHGVAWKRGILLLGPPGNGKTHCIKALVNATGKACLYVRSLQSHDETPHDNMAKIFKQARKSSPCIMVLEDLDSLIDDKNRSFFLNELDGFASNNGILTIATTNHPEKLDSAIMERPSRFDRKYTFELPALAERKRYLEMIRDGWEEDLRFSDEDLLKVAKKSNGFSFAYLKELCLSSMMAWMLDPRPGTMGSVMLGQAKQLRPQIGKPESKIEE